MPADRYFSAITKENKGGAVERNLENMNIAPVNAGRNLEGVLGKTQICLKQTGFSQWYQCVAAGTRFFTIILVQNIVNILYSFLGRFKVPRNTEYFRVEKIITQ